MNVLVLTLFVEHPERALLVGVAFLVCFVASALARAGRSWPYLLSASSWLLYAAWEAHLRGKGYNIRVDLFLIAPVLLLISALGVVLPARRHGHDPVANRPGDPGTKPGTQVR